MENFNLLFTLISLIIYFNYCDTHLITLNYVVNRPFSFKLDQIIGSHIVSSFNIYNLKYNSTYKILYGVSDSEKDIELDYTYTNINNDIEKGKIHLKYYRKINRCNYNIIYQNKVIEILCNQLITHYGIINSQINGDVLIINDTIIDKKLIIYYNIIDAKENSKLTNNNNNNTIDINITNPVSYYFIQINLLNNENNNMGRYLGTNFLVYQSNYLFFLLNSLQLYYPLFMESYPSYDIKYFIKPPDMSFINSTGQLMAEQTQISINGWYTPIISSGGVSTETNLHYTSDDFRRFFIKGCYIRIYDIDHNNCHYNNSDFTDDILQPNIKYSKILSSVSNLDIKDLMKGFVDPNYYYKGFRAVIRGTEDWSHTKSFIYISIPNNDLFKWYSLKIPSFKYLRSCMNLEINITKFHPNLKLHPEGSLLWSVDLGVMKNSETISFDMKMNDENEVYHQSLSLFEYEYQIIEYISGVEIIPNKVLYPMDETVYEFEGDFIALNGLPDGLYLNMITGEIRGTPSKPTMKSLYPISRKMWLTSNQGTVNHKNVEFNLVITILPPIYEKLYILFYGSNINIQSSWGEKNLMEYICLNCPAGIQMNLMTGQITGNYLNLDQKTEETVDIIIEITGRMNIKAHFQILFSVETTSSESTPSTDTTNESMISTSSTLPMTSEPTSPSTDSSTTSSSTTSTKYTTMSTSQSSDTSSTIDSSSMDTTIDVPTSDEFTSTDESKDSDSTNELDDEHSTSNVINFGYQHHITISICVNVIVYIII